LDDRFKTLTPHGLARLLMSIVYKYRILTSPAFQPCKYFPVGVSPFQLVNLHRNRRYFVIKLHTWFFLSYFLKTNIKFYCIYQYFVSIKFFQHRICFSIQPPDYQWDWIISRTYIRFYIYVLDYTHNAVKRHLRRFRSWAQ
jgi:hypothetical protein